MHNVILIHGHSSSPNSFWFPYIKNQLVAQGHLVWAPQLPDPLNPNLKIQLPYLLEHGKFTPETIIIAHSAGCPLTIALLEALTVKIRQVILVAAFITLTKPLQSLNIAPILKNNYAWEKIRAATQELIIVNSNNDPWGSDDTQAKILLEHLGCGTLVMPYNEGHMGSETFQQPYTEFPLLLRLVTKNENII